MAARSVKQAPKSTPVLQPTEDNWTQVLGGQVQIAGIAHEAGLLTAMAYVDLNPIRAGIAKTPEDSDFTLIEQRSREMRQSSTRGEGEEATATVPLKWFLRRKGDASHIPYRLEAYSELVDWTARGVRADKRGAIDERLPSIMVFC